MKILINDIETNYQSYRDIFNNYGYERNELIFRNSFESTKEFLLEQLQKAGGHIDLIITNEITEKKQDVLKANELLFLKNTLTTSFSKRNFRISSIPIILYSNRESKVVFLNNFDSIVKKDNLGNHLYFLSECERLIKDWRRKVLADLDILELKFTDLNNFQNSKKYETYIRRVSKNAIDYFATKTQLLSLEFIESPCLLKYDWLLLEGNKIEQAIYNFIDTYKNHQKYDSKNGERGILHEFFKRNKTILLRDSYVDMEYELKLNELDTTNSEQCDFILKTEYPDFLNTTFFEVKKEDVNFYVKKNTKRPQMSSAFLSHLKQVWGYKEFAENPLNEVELAKKLNYETQNFDFILLAGRKDEKEEVKETFEKEIDRMFNGINVITYEELEEVNIGYLERFNRLNIQ